MKLSFRTCLAALGVAFATVLASAQDFRPDFQIGNITLTQVPTATGETFTATITVANVGEVAGAPGTLRVWVSRAISAETNEAGSAEVTLSDNLATGATHTVSFSGMSAAGTAGYHHFRAFVDADGDTDELSDGNNQATFAYVVADGSVPPGEPKPDFSIHSIVFEQPLPTLTGAVFSVSVTVTNTGAAAGVPGKLRAWVSRAGAAQTNEGASGATTLTGSLAAGAALTRTFTGLTASTTNGTHHFRAFVDANGQEPEESDYNNQATATYTLSDGSTPGGGTSKPDFSISAINFLPSAPTATGQLFSVEVTVTNGGAVAGAPGVLRVWVSRTEVADTNEMGSAEVTLSGLLATGTSHTVTFANLVAPGTASIHYFWAFIDADGQTDEPSEWNQSFVNYTLSGGSTGGGYTPKPDFAISSIVIPSSIAAGAPFDATITVTNTGAAAGDPRVLRVWVSRGMTAEANEAGSKEVTLPGNLAAGASFTTNISELVAPSTNGTHHFRAFVDADNETAELSDYNNQATATYLLTGGGSGAAWEKPDFMICGFSLAPTPGATGELFTATITVTNAGVVAGNAGVLRIWKSRATAADVGDPGDTNAVVGQLAVGATATVEFQDLTAPFLSGTHHFRAFVDADGATPEMSDYNNQLTTTYTLAGGSSTPGSGWEKPDFVVTGIVLDPIPDEAGEEFKAYVTVQNTGAIGGNAGKLRAWVTRATAAGPGEGLPGSAAQEIGTLAVGATYVLEIPGLEASSTNGTHHFRALIDANGVTDELSEFNNYLSSTYTIAGAPGTPAGDDARPDNAVTAITFDPTPSAVNDPFTVHVTVTNKGDVASAGGILYLFGSKPTWAITNDVGSADQSAVIGAIPPGGFAVTNFTMQVTTSGTHHVRAYLVGTDAEWSTGDNQMAMTYTIGDVPLDPAAQSDFAVAELTFLGPPPTISGDSYYVHVAVQNHGGADGDGGMLYLFTSLPSFVQPGFTNAFQAAVPIGTLAAGATRTFDVKLNAPLLPRGTHHVRAFVLSPEAESNNKGDNQLAITYSISAIAVNISAEGDGFRLTWNNFWGERYTIYRSTDLANPTGWLPWVTGIESARPVGDNTYPVVAPLPNSFYRIAVENP